MPVQTIFENLEAGMSVKEITEVFDVTEQEVKAVVHFATQSLEKAPPTDEDLIRQRHAKSCCAKPAGPPDLICPPDRLTRTQEWGVAPAVLGNQQWPDVRVHLDRIVAAVNAATPGSYSEVDIPHKD